MPSPSLDGWRRRQSRAPVGVRPEALGTFNPYTVDRAFDLPVFEGAGGRGHRIRHLRRTGGLDSCQGLLDSGEMIAYRERVEAGLARHQGVTAALWARVSRMSGIATTRTVASS